MSEEQNARPNNHTFSLSTLVPPLQIGSGSLSLES